MPQMPKRVKYRKTQRGKIRGNATRGNTVSYGEFGLQALEAGWLSAEAIEAGRITAAHAIRGEGRLFIRVFPHKSVTSVPAATRMGKGKGEPEFRAAVVKPGRVRCEICGGAEAGARDPLGRRARRSRRPATPWPRWPTRCRSAAASSTAGPTWGEDASSAPDESQPAGGIRCPRLLLRGVPDMKAAEMRAMSDEQLSLTLKDTIKN